MRVPAARVAHPLPDFHPYALTVAPVFRRVHAFDWPGHLDYRSADFIGSGGFGRKRKLLKRGRWLSNNHTPSLVVEMSEP